MDTMDVGRPYADLLPGARGKVAATLARLAVPVTVRALARHAGVSPQAALDAVNGLADAGLVRTERAGGLVMAGLNRDHLLAEPLEMLISVRVRLVERLTAELQGWPDLAAAWLFGSAARGDGGRGSDIDLFLVADGSTDHPHWGEAVGSLAYQVEAWTGNRTEIVEHSWESFVRLVRTDNVLISAIHTDGVPLTERSRRRLREAE
jgi:predicted nucleotidyltransferase